MDGETKRNLKALGTWACMIALGVVVVILMMGCKTQRERDFEHACDNRGGKVVYEDVPGSNGRGVYIKCVSKETGREIPL